MTAGRDFFPDVLRVIHPAPRGVRPVAFFEVYLDESGHSANKPFVVVAGFIAPADNWIGFYDEWNLTLLIHGVKKGVGAGVFHMTDLEAKQGIFKGWTQKRREALLRDLFKIISRRQLTPVGTVVDVEWFKRTRMCGDDVLELEDPYHMACQSVVQLASMFASTSPLRQQDSEGIAIIIADQHEYNTSTETYMHGIRHLLSTNGRVVSTTFGKMEQFPQLQAADIVAFELRWYFTRPDIKRWPMRQLVERCGLAITAAGPEEIREPLALAGFDKPTHLQPWPVQKPTHEISLFFKKKKEARRAGLATQRKRRK
jgi:hypothetical protein